MGADVFALHIGLLFDDDNDDIAANPPGFPGNLPDFETCPGIPDLKKPSRILKFWDHFFDFVRDCGN